MGRGREGENEEKKKMYKTISMITLNMNYVNNKVSKYLNVTFE